MPAFLALFALLATVSLLRDGVTFDETAHIAAGVSYLQKGDFRMNPEHPPLVKMWAALPVVLFGPHSPDYGSESWKSGDRWMFGFEFLQGPASDGTRRDPASSLVPARVAMVVLGVLLGLVVFAWSKELWGARGALVSLFLFSLSPTMLAHARLVTLDLPAALGFSVATWCAWRFFRKGGLVRGLALVAAAAVAPLIKFSGLLLAPILLVQWILEAARRRARVRFLGVGAACFIGSVALFCILTWAAYSFRYAPSPGGEYSYNWQETSLRKGLAADAIGAVRGLRLLPEGCLYGVAYVFGKADRRAFLNGQISNHGWLLYFPESFLLKTPPALLLLLAWLVFLGFRHRRWVAPEAWFLIVAVAIYSFAAFAGRFNIGHRHLVPIYPFLFIAAGASGKILERNDRNNKVILLLLLVLFAGSSLLAFPRYLSYFNLLAGGPRGGWRYLVDSNIDWGQDLRRLRAWMNENGVDEVALAYFGTDDPGAYGLRYRKVHRYLDFRPREPASLPRAGDVFAVSVTLLQGMYLPSDSRSVAPWLLKKGWITPDHIKEWGRIYEDRARAGREAPPPLTEWLAERGILTQEQRQEADSLLVSTFMRRVRSELTPIGRAGDSIFIYRIPR